MTTQHSCLSPAPCESPHPLRPLSSPEGDELVREGHLEAQTPAVCLLQCPLCGVPGTAAPRRAVLFPEPRTGPSWELFWFNYSSQARERIIVLVINKTKELLSCNSQTQPSCFWKLPRLCPSTLLTPISAPYLNCEPLGQQLPQRAERGGRW